MIFNQGAYLRRDLRAFPAHKEELAHRPSKVSTTTHLTPGPSHQSRSCHSGSNSSPSWASIFTATYRPSDAVMGN